MTDTARLSTTARRAAIATTASALLVLAAACGGYETEGGTGGYEAAAAVDPDPGYGAAPGATPFAAVTSAPAAPAPSSATDGVLRGTLVARQIPKMGSVVTDAKGWVLYRFDKDVRTFSSTCDDDCARLWPPALTEGQPRVEGIDPELVSTVRRSDGTTQLTVGGWPAYRYVGDTVPGQWKGQGVGGTWWVLAPTGEKNLTCLPQGTPTPVPVPSADDDGSY